MDIYCPRCGEPLDMDELHDVEGMTYRQASRDFRALGCEAVGFRCSEHRNENAANIAAAIYSISGDDLDGAASDLADAEFLGLL